MQTRPRSQQQPIWDDDEDLFVTPQPRSPQPPFAAAPSNTPSDAATLPSAVQATVLPERRVPKNVARRSSGAAATRLSRRRANAWGWACAGFVVGIVFWHFIGFWGFVYQVVLPPMPASRATIVGGSQGTGPIVDAGGQNPTHLPARVSRPRIGKVAQGGSDKGAGAWVASSTETPASALAVAPTAQ